MPADQPLAPLTPAEELARIEAQIDLDFRDSLAETDAAKLRNIVAVVSGRATALVHVAATARSRALDEARRASADLITEVLDQHHVSTDWFRRRGGWCWFCSCHTDGEGVHPDGDGARRAAARHQAEQVAEELVKIR